MHMWYLWQFDLTILLIPSAYRLYASGYVINTFYVAHICCYDYPVRCLFGEHMNITSVN